MGGLDPNDFRPGEATRLIELQNALGQQFYRRVMDFGVSSQYSQSLLALLEICWRGPIVGAEQACGTSYGPEDWQCDINSTLKLFSTLRFLSPTIFFLVSYSNSSACLRPQFPNLSSMDFVRAQCGDVFGSGSSKHIVSRVYFSSRLK